MKDLQKVALSNGATNANDINIDINWDELPDTPYGTLGNIPFHDTTGQIDVNGGGQLQYTLPIALPPGVKSVAPQINLVYTSGSGNGIAGYGWNISGITAISRMGKTLEKDGEIKGVQLDYSDFYQFNGQRLILKSGEYGKDGAEYVTEKYSNIKIKSVGTNSGMNGPRYFEVTFEDGSQAWYGRTPAGNTEMEQYAATPVEYNIVKWIDAQGNYITYKYVQGDRVAIIYSIEWGGNETAGTPHFNKIDFNYIRRDLREITYLNGDPYIQNYILSNVEVNANGSLFKKYSIEYKKDDKGNGYQFVKSITESNSKGESANPVTFGYQESKSGEWKETRISNTQESSVLYGDFNGDGKMDVLRYLSEYDECVEFVDGVDLDTPKEDDFIGRQIYKAMCKRTERRRAGLYLFSSVFDDNRPKRVHTGNTSLTDEDIKNSMAITLKTPDGEILPRQGFITHKRALPLGGFGQPEWIKDLRFTIYSIDPNSSELVMEYLNTIPASIYDRSTNKGPTPTWTETTVDSIKEIDLDGDGKLELVFILKDTLYYFPPTPFKVKDDYRYLIVRQEGIDTVAYEIKPPQTDGNFFGGKVKQGDFTGEGIVDFMSFDNTGKPLITNFKKNALGRFEAYTRPYSDIVIEGLREEAVVGDFTGDGKSDLMVPQAVDSKNWKLYLCTGKGFEMQEFNDFALFKKSDHFEGKTHVRGINRQFFAQDLNKDGKADLIEFYSHVYKGKFEESRFIMFYHENKGMDSNGKIVFEKQNIDGHWETGRPPYDQGTRWYPDEYDTTQTNIKPYASTNVAEHFFPAIGDFRVNNFNENILIIQKGRLVRYSHYNVSQEARITSITQGGLTTEVKYKELDSHVNPGFYAGTKKEKFPYIEMDKVSGSYAVSQLIQEARKQDFKYRGMVAHLQGKGMIGFRKSARSSWYVDGYENTKIWSGAEIDPLNEGIPVKDWTVRTVDDNTLIFPNDLSVNNTQLLSVKSLEYQIDIPSVGVKAIVPKKSISKDFLRDILEENNIVYNSYYLPKETTVKINNDFGIKSTVIEYSHNPEGLGRNYFIGRPESKTETVQSYGDTKSAKEEYIYENNLLKVLKTYNRDNSGWVQENYNYDSFGNSIEKITSNSLDTMTQALKSEYDSKGRFVVKKIDNLGLETNILYDDSGQIIKQTDPLGNVLENKYDGWGKIEILKTNLEGMTTYTYEKLEDGGNKVIEYAPDGTPKETYTNKLGQQYKARVRGLNQDTFICSVTFYDMLGRKEYESEPYFESEGVPTQVNKIEYDDSVFPTIITATAFNGKKVKTIVAGRTTIVEELTGNRSITKKTTDPLGNVISSEDKGGVINFSFNAAGEQIKAQYGNNTVTTQYDVWGRKANFHDPSNGAYSYEYNGFGQVKKEVSPKGYKEYTYDSKGQLITQVEKSNTIGLTDKSIDYSYNDKGLLIGKTGTSNGKSYSDSITYDTYGRVLENIENSNGKIYSQKDIVYDNKSRVVSYKKSLVSSGITTVVQLENTYEAWSGQLYQVKDKVSGKVLWELQNANAKGQVLKSRLGASSIENIYDANNLLSQTLHQSPTGMLFSSQYSFDPIKNELTERTRQGNFAMKEIFTYDDNNRLIQWTNPKTGGVSSNKYDQQGRITENDQIGNVQFGDTTKVYQLTGVKLNTTGKQNYLNAQIQRIIYNENNDPLYIQSKKGDVRFGYGLTDMRQMVTYGQTAPVGTNGTIEDFATSNWEGTFTKYYSEDGSFEVVRNNTSGEEKHILYIGGIPYESNVVYLKDFTQSSGSYKFLHKDYLGSIMAISDEEGNLVEEIHFDAWGLCTKWRKPGGLSDLAEGERLLNRGYTSHEHFEDIGIIHMNGRLYDPLLRRFLNADENIQDPYNTQNYNKYAYVLNNPLMYNDPSGEFWVAGFFLAWIAPIIFGAVVGAAIGAVAYALSAAFSGNWSWGGFLKSIAFGALGGAVSAGIGSLFQAATQSIGTSLFQAAAHSISQGILSVVQGGDFLQAFASGGFSSLGAAAFGLMGGSFANSAVGTVVFGAISGGIGSALTGGNFWQGVVIGGIVAGLNHALHLEDTQPDNGYDESGRKINNNGGDDVDYLYDQNGNIISSTKVKIMTMQGEVTSKFEGYGFRFSTEGTGGVLYDPSFHIAISEIGGGLAFKGLGIAGKYLYRNRGLISEGVSRAYSVVSEGVSRAYSVIPKGIQNFNKSTGGIKQWIRTGRSYSIEGGFKTYSTRWGAGGNYWKKIGNPTLQNWNKAFRKTKLPGNNWRVKDPGHFHWKKL
ncbi:hypothetical protein HZP56_08365 [Elizabethkingia anophelis]|uniref:RHS repeat-associated core domain-containing protein n=1 Tax=Elizabethkingia anophelis TaxID=1117645 RepID=UPI0021A6A84E|nr:hypothetical protein [Elizabethkingia anophelis]MCT3976920.1 hypothetical protein [Elizabethkingia anophelis]MCT4040502.1 hypothetical protein [Elizabethkingia anophelis]MCT4172997.1 hypothetical protein [Elizabethkingia anophelis]MCT4176890.1 hypothetical protein [Elizabethkingia anophelis]